MVAIGLDQLAGRLARMAQRAARLLQTLALFERRVFHEPMERTWWR